ncbi:MAG: VOC family protein [Eubacteriaceae bacterium]|nr:VOC family protein [Eubacteriaceae bacterium]
MEFKWVTLSVKDLGESLEFYNGLLGLEVASRFETQESQIVMLGEKDGPKIELIMKSSADPKGNSSVGGNSTEGGITVGLAPKNLDELIGRIKDRGLNVQGPISPNGSIRFYFVSDPDGYRIQLLEQK